MSVRVLALGALLAAASAAPGCAARGVRVELLEVSGFTEDMKVWMVFRLRLGLNNAGDSAVWVRRVSVETDFEGFNEAFTAATPRDLETPLLIRPGATATYDAAITLLNALQLQPGTHAVTFRVLIETTDEEEFRADFPAMFDQSVEPARRALQPLY